MDISPRRILRSIYFKSFVLVFTAVMLSFFFKSTMTKFNTTDPVYGLKPIDVVKEKEFGIFKTRVQTGIFIQNFPVFNIIKNHFVADLIVWFEFNTDEVMLSVIDKFSFESGKIIKKSPPDIKFIGNRTFAKYMVRVELNTNLNYHHFPLEDHRISVVLTNNFFTPYEVVFNVSNTAFATDPSLFIANWSIDRLVTNYGYNESVLDQVDKSKKTLKPVAVFMIECMKKGFRKIFIVFVPIFIAFLLSLFSFFLVLSNVVGRATLSVSSISALLGYRFVLENIMPKVGYFTTADYVYIILLALSFVVFVFQTLLVRRDMIILKRLKGKKTLADIRADLRFVNDIAFVIIISLLLLFVGFVVIT